MALMLSRLYDALRLANVPEDQARQAAEEVATYEQVKRDTYLLKWMPGALIAIVLGVFWMQWQMVAQMGQLQAGLSGLQTGLANVQGQLIETNGQLGRIDGRLTAVETRLGTVEDRLDAVESRLGRVEARLDSIDRERSQP